MRLRGMEKYLCESLPLPSRQKCAQGRRHAFGRKLRTPHIVLGFDWPGHVRRGASQTVQSQVS